MCRGQRTAGQAESRTPDRTSPGAVVTDKLLELGKQVHLLPSLSLRPARIHGLSIVRGIIADHEGATLEVKTALGRGTTFILTMPIAAQSL